MRYMITATLLLAAMLFSAGCQTKLFPEDEHRTQFDRYDRLRGKYVNQIEVEQSGRERVQVRERLTPKDW